MSLKSMGGLAPLVVGAILTAAAGAHGAVYSFAGFSWDQDNTPDQAGLIGNGQVLGGATFSSGVPTQAGVSSSTLNNGFPDVNAGFNRDLSLGRLTGLASTPNTTRFVNLPNGNNGFSTRHGVQSSWSGGRMLPNGAGDDFVVYESASSSTQVENVMIRVRIAATSTFTDWYYFAPDSFALYTGHPTEGTMATGYDLSSFGLAAGATIDQIQMANLTDADRIDVSSGTSTHAQGRVLPNSGSAAFARPDPGPMSAVTTYDSATLDPDPLYVGIMQTLVIPEPATGAVIAMGAAGLLMRRRSRSR